MKASVNCVQVLPCRVESMSLVGQGGAKVLVAPRFQRGPEDGASSPCIYVGMKLNVGEEERKVGRGFGKGEGGSGSHILTRTV